MITKVTKAFLKSGESFSSIPGAVNRLEGYGYPERDTSRVLEFEDNRYLANDDLNSEPVCVSNIRVFRELPGEGVLWIYRTGVYRSSWIEVRKSRFEARKLARRAERLGVESVYEVFNALARLENYPILDEDDESEAEREEQEEHWDSYGRHDFEKLLEQQVTTMVEEGLCAEWTGLSPEQTDKLYWQICEHTSTYPERIDSSAWDFGDREERYGRSGKVREAVENGEFNQELRELFPHMP